MRKFLWATTLGLLLLACAIWSPWLSWDFSPLQLLGIVPPPAVGGLQVTSLAGSMKVYVDGEDMGTVDPETSPVLIPAITPGQRQIRLVRETEVVGGYWEFNRLIEFDSGVDVVIAYELGPTEEFSGGHVIYATRVETAGTNVLLGVSGMPDLQEVVLDNLPIGNTPILGMELDPTQQHIVKLSRSGYETQEFTLLPSDVAEREKLRGYKLNVEVKLFMLPIAIN